MRLVHRERRVDVRAGQLPSRRDGGIRRPTPGGDAALEARELDVVAHRDREDGELRLAEQVHPDRGRRLVGQRPDVGVLARGVAFEDLQRNVAQLVDA